jgi:hypothetical protein
MQRLRPILLLGLIASFIVAMALPVLATEGATEDEGTETTETTVAPEPIFENGEPAVVIPPTEEAEDAQPWTSRFIYPTLVAVTILLVVGLVIGYNHSIRNRYTVVDGS